MRMGTCELLDVWIEGPTTEDVIAGIAEAIEHHVDAPGRLLQVKAEIGDRVDLDLANISADCVLDQCASGNVSFPDFLHEDADGLSRAPVAAANAWAVSHGYRHAEVVNVKRLALSVWLDACDELHWLAGTPS